MLAGCGRSGRVNPADRDMGVWTHPIGLNHRHPNSDVRSARVVNNLKPVDFQTARGEFLNFFWSTFRNYGISTRTQSNITIPYFIGIFSKFLYPYAFETSVTVFKKTRKNQRGIIFIVHLVILDISRVIFGDGTLLLYYSCTHVILVSQEPNHKRVNYLRPVTRS